VVVGVGHGVGRVAHGVHDPVDGLLAAVGVQVPDGLALRELAGLPGGAAIQVYDIDRRAGVHERRMRPEGLALGLRLDQGLQAAGHR
jgi:hypothetical protein